MNRAKAQREIVLRALTRPSSLLPAAALVVTGVLTGLWPLHLLAAGVYGVLAWTSAFNVDEAKKVLAEQRGQPAEIDLGPELRDPVVRAQVARAEAAERQIQEALAAAPVDLPEVRAELVGLMGDVRRLAAPAESMRAYLASVDERGLVEERDRIGERLTRSGPEAATSLEEALGSIDQQLAVVAEMRGKLDRYDARMTQLVASLGAIRAQVARLSVGHAGDESARILEQVTGARDYVSDLAQAVAPATGQPPGALGAGA